MRCSYLLLEACNLTIDWVDIDGSFSFSLLGYSLCNVQMFMHLCDVGNSTDAALNQEPCLWSGSSHLRSSHSRWLFQHRNRLVFCYLLHTKFYTALYKDLSLSNATARHRRLWLDHHVGSLFFQMVATRFSGPIRSLNRSLFDFWHHWHYWPLFCKESHQLVRSSHVARHWKSVSPWFRSRPSMVTETNYLASPDDPLSFVEWMHRGRMRSSIHTALRPGRIRWDGRIQAPHPTPSPAEPDPCLFFLMVIFLPKATRHLYGLRTKVTAVYDRWLLLPPLTCPDFGLFLWQECHTAVKLPRLLKHNQHLKKQRNERIRWFPLHCGPPVADRRHVPSLCVQRKDDHET